MANPSTTPARTARSTPPDVITSPIAGATMVAELREHAGNLAAGRRVRDLPRLDQTRVRAILRTARQIEDVHAASAEEVDDDLDAELDDQLDHTGRVGEEHHGGE